MAQFSAIFNIDAKTLEDAIKDVGSWTVTPGTVLVSLTGMVSAPGMPMSMEDGGLVADGRAAPAASAVVFEEEPAAD